MNDPLNGSPNYFFVFYLPLKIKGGLICHALSRNTYESLTIKMPRMQMAIIKGGTVGAA